MTDNEQSAASNRRRQIVDDARRMREQREKTYRERALRLFPWICARCGREFSGKKLRELTVHHKDHDHDNNPPDGSNWELLCIYCHENEHSRHTTAAAYGEARSGESERASMGNHPFADLATLLKDSKK